MSIIAPFPISGISPKKETLDYEMLKPPPYLPRRNVDALSFDRLVDLSSDIMAPVGEIIARPFEDYYEVLFGYDYLQAYKIAVPRGRVIVNLYHYTNSEAVRIAFELNSAHYNLSIIEVAEAYKAVLTHFSWRNADLARALNVKPSTICNRLKITLLHDDVKELVKSGKLSSEHAKSLCRLSQNDQCRFANLSIKHQWNTRQLYKKIHPDWKPKGMVFPDENAATFKNPDVLSLEEQLSNVVGCPTSMYTDKNKKHSGSMSISFSSISELAGLVERVERNTNRIQNWKGTVNFSIDGLDHLDDMLMDINPEAEY